MRLHIRRPLIIAVVAIHLLIRTAGYCNERSSNWGRGILSTQVLPSNGPQLDVWFIREESRKLVGSFTLTNFQSGDYKPVKLVIEGEWRQGVFWATASLQVSDLARGPWRSISSQSNKRGSARVVVEPGGMLKDLKIDLEAFRSYIDRFRVGRVVLNSGDAGVLLLSDLKPPERE